MSNGWSTNSGYTGNVSVVRAPGLFRDLGMSEGSVVNGAGSAPNEPTWSNLSTSTYNHNIANGRTGARRLDLPVVAFGASPIDLIKRPVANENNTNPNLLGERFFTLASLRILLSDTANDITSLPTVTPTPPIPLGVAEPWAVDINHQPFAQSPGVNLGAASTNNKFGSRTPSGTPLLGGYIKIERKNGAGVWTDVTLEILNLGIGSEQLSPTACGDPSPNAIVRLERPRSTLNGCATNSNKTNGNQWSPNVLYDAREGAMRDTLSNTAPMNFGGVMHYVEIDAHNLSRWFQGVIGTTGTQSDNANGFTVYFSDRRGNRNTVNQETGEYGFEDVVNPASGTGTPNGVLDTGEDFNGNGQLDNYGQTPRAPYSTPGGAQVTWGNLTTPLQNAARPWTNLDPGNAYANDEEAAIAERNPALFFRRGLKLTNGSLGNLAAPGLTIASENPVYVQGNWNANGGFGNPHVATAVLTDSLTLLSGNWNDYASLLNPHDKGGRPAQTTWYRMAVIAGKGLSFPYIAGHAQDYGTDGGAHNFLRFLEDWGGQTLNFRGAIASLFTSRQADGTYKCCSDVYAPPSRGFNFDTDFLTPSLLPPHTPMFRDVNVTGFAQLIRPQ